MAIEIYSNNLRTTEVLIRDLGIIIPGNGGFETLDNREIIAEARDSNDLLNFLTDDFYGTDGSTLIMFLGTEEIIDVINALNSELGINTVGTIGATGPTGPGGGATGSTGPTGPGGGATGPTGPAGSANNLDDVLTSCLTCRIVIDNNGNLVFKGC